MSALEVALDACSAAPRNVGFQVWSMVSINLVKGHVMRLGTLTSMSTTKTYGKAPKRNSSLIHADEQAVSKRRRVTPEPAPEPTKSLSTAGISKRMLGRSRTESSIDSSSSSSIPVQGLLSRMASMPLAVSSQDTTPSPPKDRVQPHPTRSRPTVARTYAGPSRSFLASSSMPHALTSISEPRESYTSLRKRLGVDNSDEDYYQPPPPVRSMSSSLSSSPNASPSKSPRKTNKSRSGSSLDELALPLEPLPEGMMNPLKSITELRNRGESRRFMDEVGYLFEGLDTSVGMGLKRTTRVHCLRFIIIILSHSLQCHGN
jgi:hypothetical protein